MSRCRPLSVGLIVVALCAALVAPLASHGATLVLNRGLLVSDTLQTVPAGKMWKVESLHGSATATECRQTVSTGIYRLYSAFGFQINGVTHYITLNPADGSYYNNAACTTNQTVVPCYLCCDGRGTQWCQPSGCIYIQPQCQPAGATVIYDKVAFPIWLPEGSTLRTLASGSSLSVLEFNLTP